MIGLATSRGFELLSIPNFAGGLIGGLDMAVETRSTTKQEMNQRSSKSICKHHPNKPNSQPRCARRLSSSVGQKRILPFTLRASKFTG
jgi:hypothetical protein